MESILLERLPLYPTIMGEKRMISFWDWNLGTDGLDIKIEGTTTSVCPLQTFAICMKQGPRPNKATTIEK